MIRSLMEYVTAVPMLGRQCFPCNVSCLLLGASRELSHARLRPATNNMQRQSHNGMSKRQAVECSATRDDKKYSTDESSFHLIMSDLLHRKGRRVNKTCGGRIKGGRR